MSEFTVVTANDVPGRKVGPGIVSRKLWEDQSGVKALVVDFEPGAVWPELDVHSPGPEIAFVVSGVFNDGETDHPAGTLIYGPAGSSHMPQSETGCRLFVVFPEG